MKQVVFFCLADQIFGIEHALWIERKYKIRRWKIDNFPIEWNRPWHVSKSNPWTHRMDGPLMGFPIRLATGMCAHRSHDEWAQRSSGWWEWYRCRRVWWNAWNSPQSRRSVCLDDGSNAIAINIVSNQSICQKFFALTLVDHHEVWMAIFVDFANTTEQKTNARVFVTNDGD